MQGVLVQSLVGNLRFHMPCGVAKKLKEMEEEEKNIGNIIHDKWRMRRNLRQQISRGRRQKQNHQRSEDEIEASTKQ